MIIMLGSAINCVWNKKQLNVNCQLRLGAIDNKCPFSQAITPKWTREGWDGGTWQNRNLSCDSRALHRALSYAYTHTHTHIVVLAIIRSGNSSANKRLRQRTCEQWHSGNAHWKSENNMIIHQAGSHSLTICTYIRPMCKRLISLLPVLEYAS